MRNRRLATVLAASLASGMLLVGCGQASTTSNPATPSASQPAQQGGLLEANGLSGKSVEQIIETMDQSTQQRPTKLMGGIKPDSLVITDGQTQQSLPMPADKFYVSVAPYVSRTHNCYFHNLGTCQGEQVRKQVKVLIKDDAGKVLVDETTTTYTNGFVGYWLPRNIKGTIQMTVDGKTGSVPFGTGPQDATCITTLQIH